MALNSIGKMTIAAGARDLNESIHSIGTPTWMMFDEDRNKVIEPGDVISGNVLYKDELFQLGDPGSRDTFSDEFIDPYEHFQLPWTYSSVILNIPVRAVQRNLGRFKVSDLQDRNDVLNQIPQGSRNTLINMLAPRFRNLRTSLAKKCAKHFFVFEKDREGRDSPSGIDIITEPDTEYAGLAYNGLRQADWYSNLMGVYPEMWNPLYKDLTGSDQISLQHMISAADDVRKMDQFTERPDPQKPWVIFLMSRNRYTQMLEWKTMAAEFEDEAGNTGTSQRRRNSSGDVELGATDEFVHSRLRMKFRSDPNITSDKIVYFFKEGTVKKRMQYEQNFGDMIEITRSWNQPILKVVAEFEYQYLCNQRCSTGRLTQQAALN